MGEIPLALGAGRGSGGNDPAAISRSRYGHHEQHLAKTCADDLDTVLSIVKAIIKNLESERVQDGTLGIFEVDAVQGEVAPRFCCVPFEFPGNKYG